MSILYMKSLMNLVRNKCQLQDIFPFEFAQVCNFNEEKCNRIRRLPLVNVKSFKLWPRRTQNTGDLNSKFANPVLPQQLNQCLTTCARKVFGTQSRLLPLTLNTESTLTALNNIQTRHQHP